MEAPRNVLGWRKSRSKYLWSWITVALVNMLILVNAPPAVLFSRLGCRRQFWCRCMSTPQTAPGICCTRRMQRRKLSSSTKLASSRISFSTDWTLTVVVNPGSSPGTASLPASDYILTIEQLRSFSYVQTIGYVRTGRRRVGVQSLLKAKNPLAFAGCGTRNLGDVIRNVRTYSERADHSASLAVQGIFFEEAYEAAPGVREGLWRMDYQRAKNRVIPSANLSTKNTDTVVTFEQSYREYRETGGRHP
ncbi:hypothetical protein AC579_1136 [Pseudocercospora musae]|uniref:Uncharacterized protein n=1 Tax=Pseudocercospora musae TaxID=113226 RepID=A0A139HGS3_9PEZI|nr:hypothetical protein AC579_1136 [Pseudocercospora musae]